MPAQLSSCWEFTGIIPTPGFGNIVRILSQIPASSFHSFPIQVVFRDSGIVEPPSQNSHPEFQEFLYSHPFLLLPAQPAAPRWGFSGNPKHQQKTGIVPLSLWNILLEWEGFMWEGSLGMAG